MIHKKHLIFLFTILLLTVHSVNAEVKIGIVKLDILFKEIPIYKESQRKMKDEFEPRANELKKISIVFNKEADEKDQLYGSISKKEIIEYLQNHNIKLKSDDIIIKDQIRTIGEYEIDINPYIDVTEKIKIVVKKN